MTDRLPPTSEVRSPAATIRVVILLVLQLVMLVELIFLVREGLWMSSVWLLAIMGITGAPVILGSRLRVRIPPEYDLLAIFFVFAALFLGEFRNYYLRFWWWDVALHATSGLLLGIVGFLLVYVLNESRRIHVQMPPAFVALFAFAFAVAGGAMWEIFEFGMDQIVGTTMQKPMGSDPSGLTDTMWDLIIDVLGAAIISLFGWWHLRHGARSFLDTWTEKFIERNPHLFPSAP